MITPEQITEINDNTDFIHDILDKRQKLIWVNAPDDWLRKYDQHGTLSLDEIEDIYDFDDFDNYDSLGTESINYMLLEWIIEFIELWHGIELNTLITDKKFMGILLIYLADDFDFYL